MPKLNEVPTLSEHWLTCLVYFAADWQSRRHFGQRSTVVMVEYDGWSRDMSEEKRIVIVSDYKGRHD